MAIQGYGSLYSYRVQADTARIRRKRNGLQEGECTFEAVGDPGTAGAYLEAALPLGRAHPYNFNVWMEQQEIIYTAKGALAVCTYAGVTFEWLEKPTYELILGMEEAPIETHPNFATIAGTPSSPLHGALFIDPSSGEPSSDDDSGVFERFLPYVGGNKNPKGGIEGFLDPVATYRESFVSYSLPSASGFGNIVSDVPGPGFRGSLGRRNWLYVGFTYRRRGSPNSESNRIIYEVAKEWKLSGKNGWDTHIYAS